MLCCLSSMPELNDSYSNNNRFNIALLGQAFRGIASPFISCLPTKISQNWFNDSEKTLATILLGMSNPIGIAFGQFFTPMIVKDSKHIYLMNIIWFVPACIGSILTIITVNMKLKTSTDLKFMNIC